MTFAIQVRAAREALHMTQDELATAIDRDKQSVSNWECGRNTPWPKEQVRVLTVLLELQRGSKVAVLTRRERVCDRI